MGKRRHSACACLAGLSLLAATASPAGATPGSHPLVVSTWDTTSSSLGLGASFGAMPHGRVLYASYYSNFSSTSGNVSTQLALHFSGYQDPSLPRGAYGAAASAATVFSWPVAGGRHASGLPRLALGGYVAIAPVVHAESGALDLWLPLVAGVALPWSPRGYLTVTPWVEVAGGASNPAAGDNDVLWAASGRGGVGVSFHLSRFELGVTGVISSIGGTARTGAWYGVAAQLLWHWDRVVPADLPSDRRLADEPCDAVGRRWQQCQAGGPPGAAPAGEHR